MEDEYQAVLKTGGYRFLDKVVYRVYEDVDSLLNGLTTNYLSEPTNAFLERNGKLVVCVDQHRTEDAVLLAFEASYEESFLKHIEQYLTFSNAKMEKTSLLFAHVFGNSQIGLYQIPKTMGYYAFLQERSDVSNLPEISEVTYDVLRIEAGLSIQGVDFDQPVFLETNWDSTVSYEKGCYLGQEVMARIHNLGKPKQKLLRLLFDEKPQAVKQGDKVVGEITSSCYSPKYKKYVVMAMVRQYDETFDHAERLD